MSPQFSYIDRPWRVGRREKRHIYMMAGEAPSDLDTEIAVTVGPEAMAEVIAWHIVETHNRALEERERE